ncbi:metallo-beta-lactamase family protein RNA-specific [Vibrio ichthyoenteri ATCC 700023]|uniref:Metallo-beta-lactamase family protein RNA-specific n=1 Tax=Vibrio ichthyoenteri ATCC 700023 TaxID=870968 RepID=F9RWC7_9VIBR|nr:MBL fold metallo-hydrolase [Vibrio ichthyoenteri]EGU49380.1 metallo-beta-lactamase family protein RNA-specific [Vibrio ichthyoenteri ATCC 700023]
MQLIHHGGKDTVTGSCHELRVDDLAILIDCGLFQGQDKRPLEIEFAIKHLQALLLTHAHIDHIGRLPWLLAQGFKQPIYCTEATAELAPLMLEDSLKLQLGLSKKQVKRVLKHIQHLLRPQAYNQWFEIPPLPFAPTLATRQHEPLKARFQHAGHILGSAYIEVLLPNQEIVVFSGDLGPSNTPLLPDPVPPSRADYLLIESTYGAKTHDDIQTRSNRLLAIIERSLADGGAILIPAFSVGRTQELLFDIEQLIHQQKINANLPIILDSPMAQKVTKSYRRFQTLWGKEAKQRLNNHRHPLAFEQCITVEDHRTHQRLVNRLTSTGEAAIVVAASGMCQGGRIMDYLQALLSDKRTDVLLIGYQAQGTLGWVIQSGDKQVIMDDQVIDIHAQVHTMSGYSAHADQTDLLRFIEGISPPPKEVHLIHGEVASKTQFAKLLQTKGYQCIVP